MRLSVLHESQQYHVTIRRGRDKSHFFISAPFDTSTLSARIGRVIKFNIRLPGDHDDDRMAAALGSERILTQGDTHTIWGVHQREQNGKETYDEVMRILQQNEKFSAIIYNVHGEWY